MWQPEWEALSARIDGIVAATEVLFQSMQSGARDTVHATKAITNECDRSANLVLGLMDLGDALPTTAKNAVSRFKTLWTAATAPTGQGAASEVQARVVLLASIRSELDYLLADHDAVIRSHVTRAFEHLRRSLVVDEALQEKWLKAFNTKNEGETSCERLGGVHLLLHGIWAFKVSATGERTDLVLGTRLVVDRDVIASAHGLILTEWKRVTKRKTPDEAKAEAKHQAARYSEGSLVGFELRPERYLVLVGEEEFIPPDDDKDPDAMYRVIPIVIHRKTPSAAARSRGLTE